MSKNTPELAAPKSARLMTTKTLAYCAMLAAVQVALARLVVPMPAPDTRFSIEAVPVVLAGMLFGPIPGALVGFAADLVGCLFSAYGYNPIFAVPPILYGVCGGLFRYFLSAKPSLPRIFLTYLPPVVLGSILYQSFALAYIYAADGAFATYLSLKLATRGIQFAVIIVVEAAVTHLLLKSRVFHRLGVWPPKARQKRKPAGTILTGKEVRS